MQLQSTQLRTLNPQLIDGVAADVFWGYCFRTDYRTAINCVLSGSFEKLWTLKKAAKLLRQHDPGVDDGTVRQCYRETNSYMMDKASQEQNIIGMLYTEDFLLCRPPGFTHDELVQRLRAAGEEAEGESKGSPPVAGDLLIRTPLPAVLLLRDRPPSDWIRVADTRKALGFQKTMVLLVRSFSPLPVNPQGYGYAACGVFQIPCRDRDASAPVWFKLMPNSTACEKLVLC
jgi:hypothetical protein